MRRPRNQRGVDIFRSTPLEHNHRFTFALFTITHLNYTRPHMGCHTHIHIHTHHSRVYNHKIHACILSLFELENATQKTRPKSSGTGRTFDYSNRNIKYPTRGAVLVFQPMFGCTPFACSVCVPHNTLRNEGGFTSKHPSIYTPPHP